MKYDINIYEYIKVRLASALPYITWELIQDPQNKKRNPRKNIILFMVKENLIEEIYMYCYICYLVYLKLMKLEIE